MNKDLLILEFQPKGLFCEAMIEKYNTEQRSSCASDDKIYFTDFTVKIGWSKLVF